MPQYVVEPPIWSPLNPMWADTPADNYINRQLAANPNWNPGMGDVAGNVSANGGAPDGFQLSPTPTQGNGPFGLVPGQLGLPDPAADLGRQIPGLPGLNAQASGVLSDYLGGQLPADVQAQIQDASAVFGVQSGMPGSGLQRNRTARDLGLTSLDLTGRGLSAYGPFVGAVSGTQTVSPALQAQIAEQNAVNRAAPNPAAAQSHAKQLFDQYTRTLAGPQGGTRGFAPPPQAFGGYGGFGGYQGGGLPYEDFGFSVSTPRAQNFSGVPTVPDFATGGFGTLQGDYGGLLGEDFTNFSDFAIDDYFGAQNPYYSDDWGTFYTGG